MQSVNDGSHFAGILPQFYYRIARTTGKECSTAENLKFYFLLGRSPKPVQLTVRRRIALRARFHAGLGVVDGLGGQERCISVSDRMWKMTA